MRERSRVQFEGRFVNVQGEVEVHGQACHSTARGGLKEMSLSNGKVRNDNLPKA